MNYLSSRPTRIINLSRSFLIPFRYFLGMKKLHKLTVLVAGSKVNPIDPDWLS